MITNPSLPAPALEWLGLLNISDEAVVATKLKEIFLRNLPSVAELIFSADCEFACSHCIYSPAFAIGKQRVSVDAWQKTAVKLVEELGVDTFVYSGRAVTAEGAAYLAWLRTTFPFLKLGMIDNGISLRPFADTLTRARLDWIDLSFDGIEVDHDRQRGRSGAFQSGLIGAELVRNRQIAQTGSISTCLTSLNKDHVLEMIRLLFKRGYNNFFIIPMVLGDGRRPGKRHLVTGMDIAILVTEAKLLAAELGDIWIELNLYMPEYLSSLLEVQPELASGFNAVDTHIRNTLISTAETHLSIGYYPISLTGTKEIVINSDGDLLLPRAISKTEIASEDTYGNILIDGVVEAVHALPRSRWFEFYTREIARELAVLKEVNHGLGK